jgi:hypothetical protein
VSELICAVALGQITGHLARADVQGRVDMDAYSILACPRLLVQVDRSRESRHPYGNFAILRPIEWDSQPTSCSAVISGVVTIADERSR